MQIKFPCDNPPDFFLTTKSAVHHVRVVEFLLDDEPRFRVSFDDNAGQLCSWDASCDSLKTMENEAEVSDELLQAVSNYLMQTKEREAVS